MIERDEAIFSKIIDFIKAIGIQIEFCTINNDTFLPGLRIENGVLQIDKNKLSYIGDTLHEAGHIALMSATQRKVLSGELEGQTDAEANEMAVIAWTYAACLEIGIDPAIVFHADGYKGGSENILQNFSNGQYFGVPILEWYRLTERVNKSEQNTISFPKMVSWIRV
jgi:antirestriction protein ArdC